MSCSECTQSTWGISLSFPLWYGVLLANSFIEISGDWFYSSIFYVLFRAWVEFHPTHFAGSLSGLMAACWLAIHLPYAESAKIKLLSRSFNPDETFVSEFQLLLLPLCLESWFLCLEDLLVSLANLSLVQAPTSPCTIPSPCKEWWYQIATGSM